jgi:hypothetical protein
MNMAIDWTITLGNLLTIVGGVVATTMLWQRLTDRLDVNSRETEKNRRDLDEIGKLALSTSVQQHERRIASMEEAMRTLALALEGMKNDLLWIKRSLERQERSGHCEDETK